MSSLIHTCYRIGDIDRSVEFYKALGFEESGRIPIGDEATNVFMNIPGDGDMPQLELTYNHGVDSYEIGTGYGHIAISVDDLDDDPRGPCPKGNRAGEAPVHSQRRWLAALLRPRPRRLPHRATREILKKVVVNVDGGSRGNPGPAAIAAVASTPDGEVLTDRSETIGTATNNEAEYRALLLGIRLALELEAEEVELIGDSTVIAGQVGKGWKVKADNLQPLNAKVVGELAKLDKWSIRAVKREQNEAADALVNEALDGA